MSKRPRWPAVVAWAAGWAAMVMLDGRIDLANQALLLVLAATVAAVFSGPWSALTASAAAVLAFNVAFVPPRGTFRVELRQHAVMLVAMLLVSWIVTLLVARLRWHAAQARLNAMRSDQVRRLGDALRSIEAPAAQAAALQAILARVGGGESALLLADGPEGTGAAGETAGLLGAATPDEAAGLRLCLKDGRAMGPGTGRHENQPGWYLPLRGRRGTPGAVLVRPATDGHLPGDLLAHAQALCDQAGAALERTAAEQAAVAAREQAQAHALRNTLLAAIAHDHRTPLATILGAATALRDQGARMPAALAHQLAATIADEAAQLSRLTDNTLQLARLGAVGLTLQRDWESVEELVGTVLRRTRQRDPGQRLRARVTPGLPLLRCDAVLIVQLLDNLVDNALKYGGAQPAIEIVARAVGETILIAVRDRGPGVPAGMRERIFDTFERGVPPAGGADGTPPRRGAGVGLALCRAIARAHGGELRLRPRAHGGASFELSLPVQAMPHGAPGHDGSGEPA